MTLPFKPHTITVAPMTESAIDASLATAVPQAGSAVRVNGQLVAQNAGTVYATHGLLLKNAYLFLFDLASKSAFDVGYRVTYGSRLFAVRAQPKPYDFGNICDYCSVLLEELNLA